MKKSIITLTLITIIGFGLTTASAFAWNCNGPGGGYGVRGFGGNYNTNVNDADYKKFLDETSEIRKSIITDRAELNALMAGQNPDPAKARELTAKIVDNEEALLDIARAANIDGLPGRGNALSGNCGGPGARGAGSCGDCNGPGGRGYGRF